MHGSPDILGAGQYDYSEKKHNFVPELQKIAEKNNSLQQELQDVFSKSQGDREKAAKDIMQDWQKNPVDAEVVGTGVRFRELVGGKLVESKATKDGEHIKLLGRYIMGPKNQGFLKVQLNDGAIGYIAAAYLKKTGEVQPTVPPAVEVPKPDVKQLEVPVPPAPEPKPPEVPTFDSFQPSPPELRPIEKPTQATPEAPKLVAPKPPEPQTQQEKPPEAAVPKPAPIEAVKPVEKPKPPAVGGDGQTDTDSI